jgi:DNA gyrase subunit A
VTKKGKIISFKEEQVRATGRSSQGVRGIKIASDDEVVSMDLVNGGDRDAELLIIAENGLGKRTIVSAVRNQNRGGQGVKIANLSAKTGDLIFSSVIPDKSTEVIITSKKGQVVRIPLKSVPMLSRNAQGVILMRFTDKGETVGSAALVTEEQEEAVEASE